MRVPGLLRCVIAIAGGLGVACGDDGGGFVDARVADAAVADSAVDALFDGPVDGTVDALFDGPVDGSVDATPDGSVDATPDGSVDATPDAPVDAPVDGPLDARVDATPDAPIDGPVDAPSDAPVDAPIDGGPPPGSPPTGACRDSWCWVYPLPQGNPLRDVWGSSASDVWVIGDRGTLMRYQQGVWTRHGSNDLVWGSGGLELWGSGPSDVWAAVGPGGVLRWNGTVWAQSRTGNHTVVGGTGPADVWAFDTTARVPVQWNGSAWTSRPAPVVGGRALAFGGSPGALLYVSSTGGIARWLGTAWGILDAGTHAALAVVILDSTHVVVAQSGAVSFWNGATWVTRATPVAGNWTSLAARSFDDVTVAGVAAGVVRRFHWNGATWSSIDDVPQIDYVTALWADPAGSVWSVADSAEARVWNRTSWTARTVGDNNGAYVWGSTDSDIWLVAEGQTTMEGNRVLHWNGSTWSPPAAFAFDTTWLRDLWGSGPNDYWIAAGRESGSRMLRVLLHWNGTAWSSVGPFGSEDLNLEPVGFQAVWGAAANDVYAVARGALYHYDGVTWSLNTSVPGGTDVFGSASNDVWVINGTTLWHWNGATWTARTSPQDLSAGWANSPTDVWLSGTTNTLHFDGAFFVAIDTTAPQSLPFGTTTEMFTIDVRPLASDTRLTRWVGGFGGTPVRTPAFFDAWSAWRAPSGRLYAAGHGLLVH